MKEVGFLLLGLIVGYLLATKACGKILVAQDMLHKQGK